MKTAKLATCMLALSIGLVSAPDEAFSFGFGGGWAMAFRGPASWRGPTPHMTGSYQARGRLAFATPGKGVVIRVPPPPKPAPPVTPLPPLSAPAPEESRPAGGASGGMGQGESSYGQGITTPVIRVQSRANVPLRFTLITADGSACLSRSIGPDQAMSLPVCGERIRWHDGHRYEDIAARPSRVYRFEWGGSGWAVEDVTASLN
jgi:hypothetical protein